MIKKIVADAGLLLPEAGTVDLEKFFPVDLWLVHSDEEAMHIEALGWHFAHSPNRGSDVGVALENLSGVAKDDILFLARRVNFIGAFTAGEGTTCGEWTRPVDSKGRKGFFKANPSTGVCPVNCDFCYLRGVPFASNSIALNVGEYAAQVARPRRVRGRSIVPPVINLSETGGLIEWAVEYSLQNLVQAYTDATLAAGVVPYWLTKRPIEGVNFKGAHVGISLNPWSVMSAHSPGAGCPNDLLEFLYNARDQGASTVIRWGPIYPGYERAYDGLARKVYDWGGLKDGRFTVDLLRFSKRHPAVSPDFEFRAHKWQEAPEIQRAHLERVRGYFPNAIITGCKMDPSVAIEWVRAGIIQAMPCACWL
jgi:DNA repair photolyase